MNAQDNVTGTPPIEGAPERVAVFGGTFDPPHAGHLNLARTILSAKLADHILFVPALRPPHKPDTPYSPYFQRIAMVQLLIGKEPHMSASDIENVRGERPSYTFETLRKLRALHPEKNYILLIGGDSLEQLHTWHDAEALVREFPLIAYPRPGYAPNLEALKAHWSAETAEQLMGSYHADLPTTDISATAIRDAVVRREPTPFLTKPVQKYIKDNGLYQVQKRGCGTFLLQLLLLGAGVFLWFNLILYCFVIDALIFPAPTPDYTAKIFGYTRIPVNASESLAVQTAPVRDPLFHVIYFHGNGEDISDNSRARDAYHIMGVQPWLVDYRGYGLSDGSASTKRFIEDAEAVWHHLTVERDIPADSIIVHGRSLGGAAAIHLASKYPVVGLVAESTFMSILRVVTTVPVFPLDKLRSIELIDKVKSPILFVHGTADGVVPFIHGKKLHERATAPKTHLWITGRGHNDLPQQQLWQKVYDFIRSL